MTNKRLAASTLKTPALAGGSWILAALKRLAVTADKGGMSKVTSGGGGFTDELAGAMPEPSKMAAGLMAEAAAASPAGDPLAGVAPMVDPAAAARDTAELVFTTLPAILGPSWEPAPDERERCERAMRRYYEKYGSWDLPPGWALIAAFGIYAAKRASGGFGGLFGQLAGLVGLAGGGAGGDGQDGGQAGQGGEPGGQENPFGEVGRDGKIAA